VSSSDVVDSAPVNWLEINGFIGKDCIKNKSKFITEDHFTKHMNITIYLLKLNEIIYKRQ